MDPALQYSTVTPKDVASLLSSLGLEHGEIRQLTEGWSSWTFEVEHEDCGEHVESRNSSWIFRFPRNSDVADNQRKEAAILPTIASRVDFAVPRFEHVGLWGGHPYAGYRRIPGHPLSHGELNDDTARSVAAVLSSLHDIPKSLVANACAVEPTVDAWRTRYFALREDVRTNVTTLLESNVKDAVEHGFERFLEEALAILKNVSLVHCDLGCEHILMDEERSTVAGLSGLSGLSGLIDFEDATIGDPTIDFVGIYVSFGRDTTERVRDYYGRNLDDGFEKRLYFYTWMASCHQIILRAGRRKSRIWWRMA